MFSWISFNATFPRENTVDEANVWYNRWQAFKAGRMGTLFEPKTAWWWLEHGWLKMTFPPYYGNGMSSSQLTPSFFRGVYQPDQIDGDFLIFVADFGERFRWCRWKRVWMGSSNSEFNKTRIWWPFTRPGKHTKNYGKSPFFMGKSTISMGNFQ